MTLDDALRARGIDPRHYGPGTQRLSCPECALAKHRPRDDALAFTIEPGNSAVWLCHRCGWRGGWRAERSYTIPSAPRAARPQPARHLTLAANWRDLWRTLSPITPGMTAHSYLTARGCAIPPADGDLRCAESLRHPSGYVGPALVALVTNVATREPMTLHRTWITPAAKADVVPPRLLLGQHPKAGGAIRLWSDEAVTTGLAVAEGIESALSVALVYTPCWSVLDAGNLASFPVLEGIESLLVVADHDAAGLRGARACAERWRQAGRAVRVVVPPQPGTDANDLLRAA